VSSAISDALGRAFGATASAAQSVSRVGVRVRNASTSCGATALLFWHKGRAINKTGLQTLADLVAGHYLGISPPAAAEGGRERLEAFSESLWLEFLEEGGPIGAGSPSVQVGVSGLGRWGLGNWG
jgi:hypothetical protein